MLISAVANTGTEMIRTLFSWLDLAFYNMAALVTNLMFNIASIQINDSIITSFVSRIYMVIGIYMLFKIAFSLLNGVVNPESLTDKQSGMQKIIPRTLISLILLIAVPTIIFPMAFDIQKRVLPLIPKMMLGTNENIDTTITKEGTSGTSIGDFIASSTIGAFVYPSPACDSVLESKANTVGSILEQVTITCPKDRSIFAFEYTIVISLGVGVVLTLIVLSFCLDIAIRVIKLAILQLLAPIPIISYIDPKSEKDGAFAGWLKNCISTYVDLFVKLGIIYFSIFLIREIFTNGGAIEFAEGSTWWGNTMVTVILVIAVLFFAKQAPKFVKDILGVKGGSGSIGLAGLMAGSAALLGGGGLKGSATATLGAMDAQSDAAAQGKAAPSAWGTGRDLAAKLKTGDKDAKGGIVNNLSRKLNESANRASLKKIGLTDDSLKASKNNMITAKNEENKAKFAYDQALANNDPTAASLYSTWQDKSTSSAIATSNYEGAKKEMDTRGLSPSFIDKTTPKLSSKDPNYGSEKVAYSAMRNGAYKEAITKVIGGDFKGAKGDLQTVSDMKKDLKDQHIINKGGFDPNKNS